MAIKKKDINDIQQIAHSDTIREFMDKCNDNFTLLVGCGGGPRGATGPAGKDGATGKRGNMIHWVGTEGSDSDFDSSEATEDISGIDARDGDIVFFSNAFVGYVENVPDEEDERRYVPRITELVGLKGDKGDKGDVGDNASDQFDVKNTITLTNAYPYRQLVIKKGGSQLFNDDADYSSLSNTLCVDDGIGFIKTNDTTESAAIKMLQDGFSINSKNNIYLSSSPETNTSINTSINIGFDRPGNITSDEINFGVLSGMKFIAGTGASNSKLEIKPAGVYMNNQSIKIEQSKITVQYNNIATTIEQNKISSISIEAKEILAAGGATQNELSIKSKNGNTEVIGIKNTNITVQKEIQSNNKIYSKNESSSSELVLLDSPKFSMMVWPQTAKVPENWMPLSNILISASFSMVTVLPPKPIDSNGNVYFKFKSRTTPHQLDVIRFNINSAQIYASNFEIDENNEIQLLTSETNDTDDNSVVQNEVVHTQNSFVAVPYATYVGNMDDVLDASEEIEEPSYKKFIRHILTSKGSIQNMSNSFTQIIDNTNSFYQYNAPEAFPGHIWIFKIV